MPSTPRTLKYLLSALAENSACGPSPSCASYRCNTNTTTDINHDDGPTTILSNPRTFDGSLEVGILPDSKVFDTPPRLRCGKQKQKRGTPDTSPNSSPESSVDLNNCKEASSLCGDDDEAGQHDGGSMVRLLPNTPDLSNSNESLAAGNESLIAGGQLYAGDLVMKKKKSFQISVFESPSPSPSKGSKDQISRASTPDSAERARLGAVACDVNNNNNSDVALGESTNMSVNLDSQPTSTSNKESTMVSKGIQYIPFTPSPARKSVHDKPNTNEEGGVKEEVTESAQQGSSSPPKKSATTTKSTTATFNMFTKQDLNAITPLQMSTYLTLEERKRIGTKVLTSKLKRGYNLASSETCDVCNMPRLTKQGGRVVDNCPICPVLKKRVLKKILEGAAAFDGSDALAEGASTSFDSSDLCTVDMSVGPELNESEEAMRNDLVVAAPLFASEDAFVPVVPSSEAVAQKSNPNENPNCTTHTGDKENENHFLPNDNFISVAKKSFIEAFKTQSDTLKSSLACSDCQGMEFNENAKEAFTSTVAYASAALKDHVSTEGCDLNEAVASTGETIVRKVTLVPEAVKYRDHGENNEKGPVLEFEEVYNVITAGVMEMNKDASVEILEEGAVETEGSKKDDVPIENNAVTMIDQNAKEENIEVEDTEEESEGKVILLNGSGENKYDPQVAFVDQDDRQQKVIVEDASEDASEDADDILPNEPSENSDVPVEMFGQEDKEDKIAVDDSSDAKGLLLNEPNEKDSEQVILVDEDDLEEKIVVEDDCEDVEDVLIDNPIENKCNQDEKAVEGINEGTVNDDIVLNDSPEENATCQSVNQEVHQEKFEKESAADEDAKDDDLLNGPEVAQQEQEQIKRDKDVSTLSCLPSPTNDQPPVVTIAAPTSKADTHCINTDLSAELIQSTSSESNQYSPLSSASVISGLGSMAKSVTSDATKSVVLSTVVTLMERINLTKENMLKTEDVDEQIKCAELLVKLSAAAVALKKLEELA